MSLLTLQRDMRAWLVAADADAAGRHGSAAAAGLRVYQNNYRAQLVACLEESFERTRDWIGGDAFHGAVVAHIDRVPPASWTLDAYPRDFPATLAMLYPDDAEVAELAWIECALAEAFVGPDTAALGVAVLAQVDWDKAVLQLAPTVRLRALTTNAPAIWSALSAAEAPPAAQALPEPGAILVWRRDQVSLFRAIDSTERGALRRASAGVAFADLCAELVEAHGERAGIARAGAMLGQWLADGLIVGISPPFA
jgi:hypothetical protein